MIDIAWMWNSLELQTQHSAPERHCGYSYMIYPVLINHCSSCWGAIQYLPYMSMAENMLWNIIKYTFLGNENRGRPPGLNFAQIPQLSEEAVFVWELDGSPTVILIACLLHARCHQVWQVWNTDMDFFLVLGKHSLMSGRCNRGQGHQTWIYTAVSDLAIIFHLSPPETDNVESRSLALLHIRLWVGNIFEVVKNGVIGGPQSYQRAIIHIICE